jgi:hypothetical protein
MCSGFSSISANPAAVNFRVNDFGEVLAALIKMSYYSCQKNYPKSLTTKVAAEKFVERLDVESPQHSTRPNHEGLSYRRYDQDQN